MSVTRSLFDDLSKKIDGKDKLPADLFAQIKELPQHQKDYLLQSAIDGFDHNIPLAKEIISAGANVNAIAKLGDTPDAKDMGGHTLLSMVAQRGDKGAEAAKLLIEHGANPNQTHALYWAVRNSHHGDAIPIFLGAPSVDVNQVGREGDTPLHVAATRNEYFHGKNIIGALLEAGADPTLTNDNGKTPGQLSAAAQEVISRHLAKKSERSPS